MTELFSLNQKKMIPHDYNGCIDSLDIYDKDTV